MLLRKVGTHIRQRDWFAVVVDFLIVFVGVFVGLQASNWNEIRLAKADELILIERMVNDLSAIQNEAVRKIEFLQGNLDRIEDLTAMFGEMAAPPSGAQLVAELERVLAMPGTIERSPTYLELLSGGMRRISDDGQREAIVRHDGGLLDAKESHAVRAQIIASHIQPLDRLKYLLVEKSVVEAFELSGGKLELRLALLALQDGYVGEQNQLRRVLKVTHDLLEELGERTGE